MACVLLIYACLAGMAKTLPGERTVLVWRGAEFQVQDPLSMEF